MTNPFPPVTMDPEIKELWASALESDEFQQGTGALRVTYDRQLEMPRVLHCCLGVLTELYCRATGTTWQDATKHERSILPVEVARWAGLVVIDESAVTQVVTDPYVLYESNGYPCEAPLTRLNDDLKFPFPQIAACVRESL